MTTPRGGRSRWIPGDGQVCGLFAVDIAGFTGPERDEDIRRFVHKSMYHILEAAFDTSGIPWRCCWSEDRGDGALVIVPPKIAPERLINPLPDRLRAEISQYDHAVSEPARIRMRAAAHIGAVHPDGNGLVGDDLNLLFRMLDAPPFKRFLATSGVDLAVAISYYVYENFVTRRPTLADRTAFKSLNVQVKQTRVRGWMHTP
jgi:hypothetical protein